MSAVTHPLLRYRQADASICHVRGGSRTVLGFLAEVAALAAQLPTADHVVNLCTGRYRFAVGLMAALVRQQVTLLPMSAVAAPITALVRDFPTLYALHDQATGPVGMPAFRFPSPAPTTPRQDTVTVPALRSDQCAVVLFTSGSTGESQPYARSWGALVASAGAAARMLGVDSLAGACVFGTVPHQHSYGLESIIMLALQHGLTFHDAHPLLPTDIATALESVVAPRILVTTPIHLRSLIRHEVAMPPLHRIVCATAPLAVELAREAESRFGAPVHEIYGCTEIGQLAMRRTVETLEWSCLDGIELHEVHGEIRARGAAAASDAPLNDVVELLDAKRFLLHGRKSDLVNVAGKRSSLAYLNFHLNAIDGVLDGVFVMPDATDGVPRLRAYVVAPGLSAEFVLAALRRAIDPAFLPRPLLMLASLPRNTLGKLSAAALAQMHDASAQR